MDVTLAQILLTVQMFVTGPALFTHVNMFVITYLAYGPTAAVALLTRHLVACITLAGVAVPYNAKPIIRDAIWFYGKHIDSSILTYIQLDNSELLHRFLKTAATINNSPEVDKLVTQLVHNIPIDFKYAALRTTLDPVLACHLHKELIDVLAFLSTRVS